MNPQKRILVGENMKKTLGVLIALIWFDISSQRPPGALLFECSEIISNLERSTHRFKSGLAGSWSKYLGFNSSL